MSYAAVKYAHRFLSIDFLSINNQPIVRVKPVRGRMKVSRAKQKAKTHGLTEIKCLDPGVYTAGLRHIFKTDISWNTTTLDKERAFGTNGERRDNMTVIPTK